MGKNVRKVKAVSLLSGGLDSILAVHVMMEMGIEVVPIHFYTWFTGNKSRSFIERAKNEWLLPEPIVVDVKDEFLKVLVSPKYGYGCNMNPCIDCKILFFRKAKEIMERIGAEFIISGEVLGQRPMSQTQQALRTIEKEAKVEGIVVRPLSGKIMPPTIPEIKGLIDRNLLLDIRGRSRKVQIELAKKYGLKSIPTPAGGCILTDPGFSRRLKKLMEVRGELRWEEIKALRLGRLFEISPTTLLIVARDEKEGELLRKLSDTIVEVEYSKVIGSVIGDYREQEEVIAGIMLRYAKKPEGTVRIGEKIVEGKAIEPEEIQKILV